MELPEPYIGITGFMTKAEVEAIKDLIPDEGLKGFKLMAGFLMSQKTLRGLANKYPNRYPKREMMPSLFYFEDTDDFEEDVINIIHYNTDEVESLPVQLMAMAGIFDYENFISDMGSLDGFQLNITWPAPECIEEFRIMDKIAGRELKIILQIGERALEQVNHSPTGLAARLKTYEDLVHRVLLDPSGGLGKPMNVRQMHEFCDAIWSTDRSYGVGIAGGLSAEALEGEVAELLQKFAGLSIDAEGRLRDENDNLDLEKAKAYFEKAVGLYTLMLE